MTRSFNKPETPMQWATAIMLYPELSEDCPWEFLNGEAWMWLLSFNAGKFARESCTEEMMLLAVSKTEYALQFFDNPSDDILRVHELKWVL